MVAQTTRARFKSGGGLSGLWVWGEGWGGTSFVSRTSHGVPYILNPTSNANGAGSRKGTSEERETKEVRRKLYEGDGASQEGCRRIEALRDGYSVSSRL